MPKGFKLWRQEEWLAGYGGDPTSDEKSWDEGGEGTALRGIRNQN